jgi:hypothetical protein
MLALAAATSLRRDAVVILVVPGLAAIVVVDAIEEGRQRLPFGSRHPVHADADDGALVDLAEVEAERGLVAERRTRAIQVFELRHGHHQVGGVEVLFVLARAVGVEVGRVHSVITACWLAQRQRQVARRTALGGAVADQQLHVGSVLPQDIGDRADVGRHRPARSTKVGSMSERRAREQGPCTTGLDLTQHGMSTQHRTSRVHGPHDS